MSAAPPRAETGGAAAGELTIVAHDIGPSRGMERQLTQLIEGLSGLGHRVTVIARSCELPAGAVAAVHRVRGPSRPFLIAYPWFLLAGSIALRRRRRGLVQATGAIVLGRVDVVAVHYCHQVGTSTPSRSTPLYRAHSAVSGVLRRAGERLCFRRSRARAFVCVSEGVADEVRRHYPELAPRVVTIYNGVDTERFAPGARDAQARELRSSSGLAEQGLLAAFVGSEWERKGLAQVLEALARAPEWSLLVAGEGDERRYRQIAAQLGVAERVRWLGLVEDVERVFDAADALVLASSYETFSLVTFEAAASGLAILATPVNGVAELIQDGVNGLLITRDPEVIADGLARLAADPGLRSRLGRAARESALAYGRERMVREHHELYARLAAGREPGASAATVERAA